MVAVLDELSRSVDEEEGFLPCFVGVWGSAVPLRLDAAAGDGAMVAVVGEFTVSGCLGFDLDRGVGLAVDV